MQIYKGVKPQICNNNKITNVNDALESLLQPPLYD